MAENIKLAEFNIDIDAVVKSAAQLKKSIDEIKEAQKQARKDGEASTEQYIENEAALKTLNAEYNQHIKVLRNNIEATANAANREDLLNAALNQEALTINDLREQNKLLNKLRNESNLETEDGRKEIELLNAQLDINNDRIKENVDSLSQQKINVGNYEDSIKSALSEMNPFNQSITVFISNVQEAGGAMPFFSNGIKSVTTAISGMTKAAIAFLATPIGAVIGAIGLALGLVVNALTSTQEGMDKVTAVTRPLTAVLDVLLGVIQNIGLALVEAFTNPLESITNLKNALVGIFTDPLGTIDKLVEKTGEFVDEIQRGIDLGKELDQLTKEYEQTQIRNATLIPQLNALLREQNKIAEDTTKTQSEREKAAANTIDISKQINDAKREELELELAIAENEAARNDTTRAEELEIARIKGQIYEADAQATEQQTTQQNKLNTIRKDAATQQQKAVDAQIAKQKELLSLYVAEQGERARTLAQELELAQTVSDKKKEILKQELDAKKISEESYRTALLELDNSLAQQRAELSVENAMREIEANKMVLDRKREDAQFLSQELANQRKAENDALLLQENELAQLRLEQGLINQQQYDDAIRELSEANRIANKEIDRQREEIERQEAIELRQIAFENELQQLLDEGATRFEIQQAQLAEQRQIELDNLNQRREQGLISEELYKAQVNRINSEYDRIKNQNAIANDQALSEQRLDIAKGLFEGLASIVDENSAFGKALAISQALINTFQGITAALAAPFPASIPAVATAAATGFKAVKDITSTQVPSASGKNVNAASSATASSDLQSLGSNQSNLTQVAASGNAVVQQQITDNASASGLTESVANAVRDGAASGTAQGSEQGLTNLSSNRDIMNSSTF